MTHFHPQFGIPGHGILMSDDAYGTARQAWGHIEPALRDNRAEDVMRLDGADLPSNVKLAYGVALIAADIATGPGRLHVPGLTVEDMGMTYGVAPCENEAHEIMEEVK